MTGENETETGVFWVHIASFAVYNAILGYLFRESAAHGLRACILLFVALSKHFAVNDAVLHHHNHRLYNRVGRWILAGSILTGWCIGQLSHLNEAAIAAIWALVAGGIILNVLKDELPSNKEGNFGFFAMGAAFYSVILLVS